MPFGSSIRRYTALADAPSPASDPAHRAARRLGGGRLRLAPRHSRTVAKTGTEMPRTPSPDGLQGTAISLDVAVSANELKISREGPHGTPCLKMSLDITIPIPDLLDTLSSYARISPSAGSSRDAMAASRSPSSDPTQTTGVQPVDPGDVSRTTAQTTREAQTSPTQTTRDAP